MRRVEAILILILASWGLQDVYGADIAYSWSTDGMDTGGLIIPPDSLYYMVYVSADGEQFSLLTTTQSSSYVWEDVPVGCHTAHVVAYRADADLESVPSNTAEKCVTEETDGQIQMLIPRRPESFNARWRWRR